MTMEHEHPIKVREDLEACLYDDECANILHMCIGGRCQFGNEAGAPCRLLIRWIDTSHNETMSSCGPNLTCDALTNRCQPKEKTKKRSELGGSCDSDLDCHPTAYCRQILDTGEGTCEPAAYLDEACQVPLYSNAVSLSRASPCMRPFVCLAGICRAPCLTDADCVIGRTGKHRYTCDGSICIPAEGSCSCVSDESSPSFPHLPSPVSHFFSDARYFLPHNGTQRRLVLPEAPLVHPVDYRPMTLLYPSQGAHHDTDSNIPLYVTRKPVSPSSIHAASHDIPLLISSIALLLLLLLYVLYTYSSLLIPKCRSFIQVLHLRISYFWSNLRTKHNHVSSSVSRHRNPNSTDPGLLMPAASQPLAAQGSSQNVSRRTPIPSTQSNATVWSIFPSNSIQDY
jgi:hypothetical protein